MKGLRWPLLALVAVLAVWAVPLLMEPRHYFWGDTEAAYYGWWYHFGDSLRHGSWPMYDAQGGVASNLVGEGQWALYSPLIAAIGLGATVAPNVVVYATVLKFLVAALAVTGSYLLARSYDVRPPLAAVASTAVPLCGLTLALDAPSWFNGLLVCALLPWAWWGIRRLMRGSRNPLPALVAGYLVVSTGYVYGTLYLALVIVACLLETALLRQRAAALRVLLVGVVCGLVAVTVYLPGVMTAAVTTRNTWEVGGIGPVRMRLRDYLTGGQPIYVPGAGLPDEESLDGGRLVPFTFIAWFLPMLVWTRPLRVSRQWRELSGLVLVLVVLVGWTLGPYNVGPLRAPGRIMPMVALAVVLALVVLLDRTITTRPSLLRLGVSVVWAVAAAAVAVVLEPDLAAAALTGAAVVVVGLLVTWWTFPKEPDDRAGASGPGLAIVATALVVGVLTVVALPHLTSPTRSMPAERADYRLPLAASEGDVILVGGGKDDWGAPGRSRSLLVGSAWYLSGKPVRNLYSPMGFEAYNDRFCVHYEGRYCAGALERLFTVDPATGLRQVDLQSISTVVIVRDTAGDVSSPPSGWHLADTDDFTITWVRDEPVPTAGSVVWSSPGTVVRSVTTSETTTSFVVEQVPAGGGSVVVSRLAWPGYRVDGARLGDPLDDYLMTIDVPGDAAGDTVTARFRPPGWHLEVAALAAALLLGGGWTVAVSRRRRRPPAPA